MTRSPVRRSLFFLTMTVGLPVLLLGCPKKPVPVEDSGAPTAVEPPEAAVLAPLTDDDGGDGGDAAEAGHKWVGPGVNPNQQKIMACCNSMRAQAKTLGASPEAFQLNAAAAQCDVFAKQVGPGGNAPELAQLRAMLKSVKLPAACQF